MNLSKCITQLKTQFFLNNVSLPLQDDITGDPVPPETAIRDLLVNVTIPIYSGFQPWVREVDANVKSLKVVDKKNNIYMLPWGCCTTNVIKVISVRMPYSSNRGTYGDIAPAYGIGQSVQGVITSQEMMMLAGLMRAEPTFDYLGENKIRLFGYPMTTLTFVVACEHEPNGETIEDSCYQSFMELAELDLSAYLYNVLKYFEGMPTAFGNISMKSEEYAGAAAERRQLLKDWTETFHLDQEDSFVYF
nr:MAG TPA: hypothetical protein [Caudoviricetes sp.]